MDKGKVRENFHNQITASDIKIFSRAANISYDACQDLISCDRSLAFFCKAIKKKLSDKDINQLSIFTKTLVLISEYSFPDDDKIYIANRLSEYLPEIVKGVDKTILRYKTANERTSIYYLILSGFKFLNHDKQGRPYINLIKNGFIKNNRPEIAKSFDKYIGFLNDIGYKTFVRKKTRAKTP